MTNQQTPNIVPFGKYKGQPVEVLAQDRPYLDWLTAQDWFRERYTNIYTLIVNNFAEAVETPDHNALQVLFLDDHFCLQFMRATFPGFEQTVRREFEEDRNARLKTIEVEIEAKSKSAQQYDRWAKQEKPAGLARDGFFAERAVQCHTEMSTLRARHLALSAAFGEIEFTFRRAFEVGGVDVTIEAHAHSTAHGGDNPISLTWYQWRGKRYCSEGKIEIKPSVGDDYPAVLRQMRANDSPYSFHADLHRHRCHRGAVHQNVCTVGHQGCFPPQRRCCAACR